MILFPSPAPAATEYTPADPACALQKLQAISVTPSQPKTESPMVAERRSDEPHRGSGAVARGVPGPELPVSRAG